MLDNLFNFVFGPLMNLPDPFGLLIISFILTFIITLAYKFLTDQKLMKSLKEELKELQKKMKEFKDQPSKLMEIQKEAMQKNFKYMIHSMKPTIITFLPIIIIFSWLRNYYTSLGNPPVFLGLSWIWSYIIFSIIFSIILRKIFKVH